MVQATNFTKVLLVLLQAFSMFLCLWAIHKDQDTLSQLGTPLFSAAAAHVSTYYVIKWSDCSWSESSLGV